MVNVALEAIAARDWERLRPHLHPYLHRHRTDGQRLRGRSNVIGMLEANGPQKAPASYELRDGQIYRWRAG